jgi:glycosyltransferase involved in cell wall biosynthesis
MISNTKPLLSICIPTFNRSALLELMLQSLYGQISGFEGQVQLVLSDNASTDTTWDVISYYKNKPYVCAVRLTASEYYTANWANVIEAASGEFVWVIGDDDWIVTDGVSRVFSAIEDHLNFDYFFTNHYFASVQLRNQLIKKELAGDNICRFQPLRKSCARLESEDRKVEKWEHIWDLPPGGGLWLHTSIVAHIMRRQNWLKSTQWMKKITKDEKPSADKLYPHNVIIAKEMIGKPCYFIGHLSVLMSGGAQEWGEIVPVLEVIALPQVVDLYVKLGVDKRITNDLKGEQLRYGGRGFFAMCLNRQLRKKSGFIIIFYLKQHGCDPRFWIGVLRAPIALAKKWVIGLFTTNVDDKKCRQGE